jgi:hypothetical protein
MTPRDSLVTTALALALALVLAAAPALASHEDAAAHGKHPMKVIVLDNGIVRPSPLTLENDEVLEFENHSLHPMVVTFTEPEDLQDKIRCGLVRATEKEKSQVPWQLFSWQGKKLVASIPPGRFASVCSLAPGNYTFLVSPQNVAVRSAGAGGALPEKGAIVVK